MPNAPVTTAELQANTFKRGTKVRLVDDVPGYPTGSRGRIAVANGFAWQRYWVRFADGNSVGHIDHASLVKAKDYERFLARRDREAIEAEEVAMPAAGQAEAGADDAGGGAGAAAASGGAEVNGVMIPRRLLEMSAAARARLGA